VAALVSCSSLGKEDGVVWRSLYSGLVVLGGVFVAFVAFALTVAVRS
jgi:hypothetical protein